MKPRHALDAAINAVAAVEDNLSTSYSEAILSALAAEGWVLMDVCRDPWHDNNEPVDGPCPKCGEGLIAEARETADECEWCIPRHEWPCPTIPRCDEPGCEQEATCGWPSDAGYRRTCGHHYRVAKEPQP